MNFIESRSNERYQELRRLASSAPFRKRAGQTLIEGIHLCKTYLDALGTPVLGVISETAFANPEVAEIARRLPEPLLVRLSDRLFAGLSQLEEGIGVAFVIAVPRHTCGAIVANALLIDRIQDPGNLGSVLRSAAGAGIREVICGQGTVAAWSPKVLRAGMGAHFHLRITEEAKLEELARSAEVPLLATSSHAAQSLYEIDLRRPLAWVFGNEGQGVSAALLARSQQVRIPQPGGIESLNVAAAAAVCLFEQLRQHQAPR